MQNFSEERKPHWQGQNEGLGVVGYICNPSIQWAERWQLLQIKAKLAYTARPDLGWEREGKQNEQ